MAVSGAASSRDRCLEAYECRAVSLNLDPNAHFNYILLMLQQLSKYICDRCAHTNTPN